MMLEHNGPAEDLLLQAEMKLEPTCCCASTEDDAVDERSRSKKFLSRMVPSLGRRRRSISSQEDVGDDQASDGLTISLRSSDFGYDEAPRLPGGCLKVRTHVRSLALPYQRSSPEDDRSVSFGTVDVLVFNLALGDSPATSIGPPICLGPELCARVEVSLDSYEETRPSHRSKDQLIVPKSVREDWLRDEGYTRGQFREREAELLAIKKSRKSSATSVNSKFLRLFSSKSKKRTGSK
jgi:hypothetical protein